MSLQNPITITETDRARLAAVVSLYRDVESAASESLLEELDRAVVVPPSAIEGSVVTMNSRVLCRDDRGATRELEVVYPREADIAAGRVSVLAPIGRALIGAAVGDRVEVVGRGRARSWTIEAIRYQPEAAGDYDL